MTKPILSRNISISILEHQNRSLVYLYRESLHRLFAGLFTGWKGPACVVYVCFFSRGHAAEYFGYKAIVDKFE